MFLALDDSIQKLSDDELTPEIAIETAKGFPFSHVFRPYYEETEGTEIPEPVVIDTTLGSESKLQECFETHLSPLFPWKPFDLNSPMIEVIKSLSAKAPTLNSKIDLKSKVRNLRPGNVKRVPILNPKTKRIANIISQSAIIKYVDDLVQQRIKDEVEKSKGQVESQDVKLPSIFELTALDLNLLKNVIVVDENTSMRAALEIMANTKLTAVGVVDEDGKLIYVVTTKDLLGFKSLEHLALNRMQIEKDIRDFNAPIEQSNNLDEESVSSLKSSGKALADLTVIDFIAHVRQEELVKDPRRKARAPVCKVLPTAPLKKIIARMSKAKVHRIFIVDEEGKPVGVASVRDIVRIMFPDADSS